MISEIPVIVLYLPDPAAATVSSDATYLGECEMARFWRSGDIRDLPVNPSVGVVLDWAHRMTEQLGFLRELERLGTNHQSVMDRVFQPAEDGHLDHLPETHPLILLHCLWRIGVQYGRDGYADTTQLINEVDWIATRHFWAALLPQLTAESPKLVFLPKIS